MGLGGSMGAWSLHWHVCSRTEQPWPPSKEEAAQGFRIAERPTGSRGCVLGGQVQGCVLGGDRFRGACWGVRFRGACWGEGQVQGCECGTLAVGLRGVKCWV